MYILSGKGTVSAGNKTADLNTGITLLVPADLEFFIQNTGDESITMFLINEPIPDVFRPNSEILVVLLCCRWQDLCYWGSS